MIKNKNLINMQEEQDSCGIIAVIEKNGIPSHKNILKGLDALGKLGHRAGYIDNEGDGSGILVDIPRKLWAEKLKNNKLNENIVEKPNFVVGHILIDKNVENVEEVKNMIRSKFKKHNFDILLEQLNNVNSNALGYKGKEQEPFFWQIAGKFNLDVSRIRSNTFSLVIDIEDNNFVHVASLSNYSAVYKLMGETEILPEYFIDLKDQLFESAITLGHNRFSTNTLSHFFRVQPFSLLGHNGEINTIERLRNEAEMINIPTTHQGSDSQDLNRAIEGFVSRYGLSLFTTLEMIFPPINDEVKNYNSKLYNLYSLLRNIWGPFSQGPAGIISRYENFAVFSVDALGLRPLWKLETDKSIYFSSEQGIISSIDMEVEPKPLAPGEKIGLIVDKNEVKILNYVEIQEYVLDEIKNKFDINKYENINDKSEISNHFYQPITNKQSENVYLGFGWNKEHVVWINTMSSSGKESIGSLGYDGPLAVLSKEKVNIADFIKETVAVVTNPAIDMERESAHFSLKSLIGDRASINSNKTTNITYELDSPILLENDFSDSYLQNLNATSFKKVLSFLNSYSNKSVKFLSIAFDENETIKQRLEELSKEAIESISNGAKVIVLDDSSLLLNNHKLWLDPHLALAYIDNALRNNYLNNINLRRKVSIILRSGSIRNLHDIVTAIGLGANAISPYMIFSLADNDANKTENIFNVLNKGIKKVLSTLGIYELRGYGRLFSSIGLNQEIADILGIKNFFGSSSSGFSLENLKEHANERQKDFAFIESKFEKTYHLTPRIWRLFNEAASEVKPYDEYKNKLNEQNKINPINLRHLLDFNYDNSPIDKHTVDIGIDNHELPFVISAMSFGSQNETAFRAYADAAHQLNMISISGEGGEIKDMIGKYPDNRGMQIASGRFGVNVDFINSSNWIEIKIGQGAKPGEGGHLPGMKVTDKIAAARNSTPGVELISPSNNHDIYSIEDLEQIISELKTANNEAKIIVKVPVVPNIGTIAVGIAKAGANVLSLSGFDGGTGAAREHAIQHVGLPIEIGVKLVHEALFESGLRQSVEIWADGGVKGGEDVVKLILLGANRIGFGTLSMMAIGCTGCRGCHLNTCHVGISTQINSKEEAEKLGLKRFVPREYNQAVENLKRIYTFIGNEVKEITAKLGSTSLQNLVGRADLLKQIKYNELIDLNYLLSALPVKQLAYAKSITLNGSLSKVAGSEEIDLNSVDSLKFNYVALDNTDRMVGSSISGEKTKSQIKGEKGYLTHKNIFLRKGSIPGNGLGAYLTEGINIEYQGGAQDGLAKTAIGGKIAVLKNRNYNGVYINGSVGKSCCYGAQGGLFIIQGNADSRACIRLSGADVIFGGEVTEPLQDYLGSIGMRANLKGFAFEYMTNGRVVVMGDPGPWICSGMTGGVIYQRIKPEFGLDISAIKNRIAKGSKAKIINLDEEGRSDLIELLSEYKKMLIKSHQSVEAEKLDFLVSDLDKHFIKIVAN